VQFSLEYFTSEFLKLNDIRLLTPAVLNHLVLAAHSRYSSLSQHTRIRTL